MRPSRQRSEQEDLRRQLEDNSSLAERALREEMDKSQEELKRRHQVQSARCMAIGPETLPPSRLTGCAFFPGGDEGIPGASGHGAADLGGELQEGKGLLSSPASFLKPPRIVTRLQLHTVGDIE